MYPARAMRVPFVVTMLAMLALTCACAVDPAERAYRDALRGEETGMTREQQVALLDRAIALAPRRAQLYETRAIYRIDLQQFAAARADLDQDIRLADRPYARFLRGMVACQMGDFAPSLADFDAAIAAQPGNVQFYWGRSLARSASGDPVGGLADGRQAVEIAPESAQSFHARGVALAGLGRYGEAITDFDRTLTLRPELVYALAGRANAREQTGDAAGAAEDRAAFESQRAAHATCAMCLDPYRY